MLTGSIKSVEMVENSKHDCLKVCALLRKVQQEMTLIGVF